VSTTHVLLDALRCAVIAGFAFLLGRRLALHWALLLAPLLTPNLLISYAGAPIALRLGAQSEILTAVYSAVLVLKLAPLVALAHHFLPPALCAEGAWCERLSPERNVFRRIAFALRAVSAGQWAALGIVFLVSFTDFELASLLGVKTWAVSVFDAHAGGITLRESLRAIALPALLECAVLAMLAVGIARASEAVRTGRGLRSGALYAGGFAGRFWTIFVASLIAILPVARIAWLAAGGIATLRVQDVFAGDVLVSLGYAFIGATTAWVFSAFAGRFRWLFALPGMLGSLVIALLILSAIHFDPAMAGSLVPPGTSNVLLSLRDTPVPLVLAHVLLLLPVAVLLRTVLDSRRDDEALHLARMAGSRRLLWEMAVQPRVAAIAHLFALAYFEFTAASILAPIGVTPVFVRLHNLAHYGQTAVLSAMLLAAVAAPAVLLALTLLAARLYARRDVR
jgi:iron(III) transport system permease protein